MGFRKKVTIRRKSGGHVNNDGIYVPGTAEEIVIRASVQPLNKDEKAQYTKANPDGEHTANLIKLYTSYPLRTSKQVRDDNSGNDADIILWLGNQYKVIGVDPYQSGVISHYKAVAQEVDTNAETVEEVSS